ncbi:hypothetical protein MIND_01426300 [Mycena indigotica]|uniref:CCHC-type domain-containing protein n=1 Tax=Mycena indigotica TaxID=2126181 RepID=A0A8H6RYG9_9AGAR|nr:uncharacterized protein MIND_01426300 [Mycena indigotica]KAF7288597.1 hypothetical protein MIND_01426300 [Mycena indigotica]
MSGARGCFNCGGCALSSSSSSPTYSIPLPPTLLPPRFPPTYALPTGDVSLTMFLLCFPPLLTRCRCRRGRGRAIHRFPHTCSATKLRTAPRRAPQPATTVCPAQIPVETMTLMVVMTGGLEGHVSRDCTMEAKPKACYKCGQDGHIVRDPFSPPSRLPLLSPYPRHRRLCERSLSCLSTLITSPPPFRAFFVSFAIHLPTLQSRECPENTASGGGFSSGGGGRAGTECYRCGKTGHIARACPEAGASGGYGSSGGYGGGHAGGGYGGKTCYTCGGVGHLSRDCVQGSKCYNCGDVGHISRDCPQAQRRACYTCGSEGHISRDCPNGATTADA